MEPEKVLVFGGTFDPPHNGHMTLLAAALDAVRPDLVLVEPAGTPPHKEAGETPACHRLAMCACFLSLGGGIVLDTMEIERGGRSYTVETLRALNGRWPAARLYFSMGSDMLLSFRRWVAYREIMRRAALVVHLRHGEDAAPVRAMAAELCAEGAQVVFSHGPVFPVSSTQVRAMAARGQSIAGLVPAEVAAYIAAHGLYAKDAPHGGRTAGPAGIEERGE